MTKKQIDQVIMPSNSWRTAGWIKKAYGLKNTSFYDLRQACLTTKYSDAIVQINQRTSFIREDRWQAFLSSLSDDFKAEHYGI